MKKYLLVLILFLISFFSLKSQTYRYIPDSSFRYVLSNVYSCPFSGDSLDIASGVVTGLITMNCYRRGIHSIEGVQYFTGLRNLYCYENSIDSISSLPSSLQTLYCSNNLFYSLQTLPSTLRILSMNFTHCSILPALPAGLTELYIKHCDATTMPILPSGLTWLDCSQNSLYSISTLPSSLSTLFCESCNLTSLPVLPTTLTYLYCGYNQINVLPFLPSSLYRIDCSFDSLTTLPTLPPHLGILNCDKNKLTSLPALPTSLGVLSCNFNKLSSMPLLNDSLLSLSCRYNNLDSLPSLPIGLTILDCSANNLIRLPTLPPTITYLNCAQDSLIELPLLPDGLTNLDVRNNPMLFCLPYLPSTVMTIYYSGTSVSCIPNIVIGASYYPTLGSQPICNPSISFCEWYTSISGKTHIDGDIDCILDSPEPKLKNISVFLKQDSSIVNISSTNANGLYAFDSFPFDDYTFDIDTTELPYLLYCPATGMDTATIDSTHTEISGKHLGLQCRAGFDVGSIGMISTSWIRPATLASFEVHAGDMSTLYGAACSFVAGSIAINYSGSLIYSGVAFGTVFPDSILPNRLVWNIADFSLLDFFEDIKPIFFIDSSTIVGDLICFTTEVTPEVGDRVPSNNIFAQCFDVRASYDPNVKDVSPSGTVTATQGWMYYTIHFQNTGNSFAENVYVWDTLDANLNMNSIQVMASSHNVSMTVYPISRAAKFSFVDINLIDSTTSQSESHGYVQYRIKLIDSLNEGTNIQNKASILFDLNIPVITNTATTTICNYPSKFEQALNLITSGSIRVGTHLYDKAGTYTDILTNIHDCDSVVITKLYISLGIETMSDSKMTIYPNPANNEVHVQMEGMNNAPLQLFDMYGKLLYENLKYADNYIINTSQFITGSYTIQWGHNHTKLMIKH